MQVASGLFFQYVYSFSIRKSYHALIFVILKGCFEALAGVPVHISPVELFNLLLNAIIPKYHKYVTSLGISPEDNVIYSLTDANVKLCNKHGIPVNMSLNDVISAHFYGPDKKGNPRGQFKVNAPAIEMLLKLGFEWHQGFEEWVETTLEAQKVASRQPKPSLQTPRRRTPHLRKRSICDELSNGSDDDGKD
jgi:hypothetical protein